MWMLAGVLLLMSSLSPLEDGRSAQRSNPAFGLNPSLRTIYNRPKKAWPKITTGTDERALPLSLFAQVETPFVSMSLPQ
jgi:hypothetical protein